MMKLSKLYYFVAVFFVTTTLVLQNVSCAKEYSNEGHDTAIIIHPPLTPPDSTMAAHDTAALFSSCAKCDTGAELMVGNWNFKTGNSYACGNVTNSGFFSGNTQKDITLFGPSACSADTGIVVSAFFSVPLDRDRYNLTTNQIEFYYYDNHAPKDIFSSQPQKVFSVTIQSFIYSTRIATGQFSGTVFKANGDTAYIREGKFKVYIK